MERSSKSNLQFSRKEKRAVKEVVEMCCKENWQGEHLKISSSDLLDSVRCSFEIAVLVLVQADANLRILGFEPTRSEVQVVVRDLQKAIVAIDDYKQQFAEIGKDE